MNEPDPNEATKQLAIAVGALTISLLDKNVITQEEYDRAYAQATVDIDQEFARKRDEAQNEAASKRGVTEAELKRLYPGPLGELIAGMFRNYTGDSE